MKKIRTFSLILVIISIMATIGCGKSENNNDSNYNEDSNINCRYIYKNNNLYENGCIIGNDDIAMFLDFDTMEKTPLCAKPNCQHKDSTCLAKIVGDTPIIYNDYVYFFDSYTEVVDNEDNKELKIESKLSKASLDSSEVSTICEFTGCEPNIPQYYVFYDNCIYFTANDLCPRTDEYGGLIYSSSGGIHYLCCINIETGEFKNFGSIYDGDKEYEMADSSSGANITGVYQNKMYIQYVFMKKDPKVTGKSIDEGWTRVNFEFDFKTQKLSQSELPVAIFTDNETYAYLNDDAKSTIVSIDDENYEIKHYDLSNMSVKINNNKAFFSDCWYGLTDMSEHSMGEYGDYQVIAYYDGCYILVNGGKTAKLTEEELLSLK